MGKKLQIYEISAANDMKYRGPLSVRWFRVIGWLCLILQQISHVLKIYDSVTHQADPFRLTVALIFGFAGSLAVPFFIIANFSEVLAEKNAYKKLLIKYGALSLVAALAFFYFYEHILLGVFSTMGAHQKGEKFISSLLPSVSGSGYFAFNLFIDLLLCVTFLFFLEHKPKKVFVGKMLIVFRLFALLPFLYEAASIVLKLLASGGRIDLPSYIYPFLTTKPPMTFVVFIVLAVFFKRRERIFIKNGKTEEEYKAFLETKKNSFQFSVFAAVVLAVAAVLDFIVLVVIGAVLGGGSADESVIIRSIERAADSGFGESVLLLFIAPLMLLYSYNRKRQNKLVDIAIPAAGVAGILLVYIEGISQIACGAVSYLMQMGE